AVAGRCTTAELLTTVALSWFPQTTHSPCRPYFEPGLRPLHFAEGERVTVPCGIAHFPQEVPFPPREWVERGYNVTHWNDMARGGHFAAMEEPDLLAADVRTFFRALR